MSQTILVTGAGGFIGSHTAEALLRRGDVVVGLDNFDDYYSPERKRHNIESVRKCGERHAHFHLVEGDLRSDGAVKRVFDNFPIDAVVHLAAMPGVRASVSFPLVYVDVNVNGTIRLLEEAYQRRVRNFVYASTSSVYGSAERAPFMEADHCSRPLAPYPASKRAAELMGYTYHHVHGLDFTALRFFTVYGPRGRPDMMPYKVLNHLFLGEEVPLYGAGNMLRDWTYISDIVAGIVSAVDKPMGYEIINLGRGQPVLVADFVAEAERQTGKRAAFRPEAPPATDVRRTHADLSKARKLLGYTAKVGISDGIERFVSWYREVVLEET